MGNREIIARALLHFDESIFNDAQVPESECMDAAKAIISALSKAGVVMVKADELKAIVERIDGHYITAEDLYALQSMAGVFAETEG